MSPFYIWMFIFTLQPHKEERFMYPLYPFLALNAAIAFHIVLAYIASANPTELIGKIPKQVKLVVTMTAVLLSINVGLLRTLGTVMAYRAPLQIYHALEAPGVAHPGDTVCFGKDWYRFPSSYFLPNGMRAKFVKSEFSGLLPGEFNEAKTGFGLFSGTWLIPPGMNDRNEEDPGKYVCTRDQQQSTLLLIDGCRSTYHTAPTWSILTFRVQSLLNWNQTMLLTTRHGRRSRVRDFLILHRLLSLQGRFGFPIYLSSQKSIGGYGVNIV